jgi:hypothetical protein
MIGPKHLLGEFTECYNVLATDRDRKECSTWCVHDEGSVNGVCVRA